MASLQKIVLNEGEGVTPKHGDKVTCMFTGLAAAGQPIPMYV
jgi:FKBP-type peptidyl-prolyl cis-trans isomerase